MDSEAKYKEFDDEDDSCADVLIIFFAVKNGGWLCGANLIHLEPLMYRFIVGDENLYRG